MMMEYSVNYPPFSIGEYTQPPPPCKYDRVINDKYDSSKSVTVDVYGVLRAFAVTSHPVAHAIKKLLMPGQRGGKDYATDLREAVVAIQEELRVVE